MTDAVIGAMSVTIETLQKRLSELEEEVNGYRASDLSKASSIFIVYSPERLPVWCEKSSCPRLNRKVKYNTESDDELSDAIMSEGIPEDAKVQFVSEPTTAYHPLGVVATFLDEDSASEFVESEHRRMRQRNELYTLAICELHLD
jgi:hypothetical protein